MLRFLLEKEFKQLLRNRFLPRVIVVFPAMVLLVFPLVANFDIKNLNLAIVDGDGSAYSRRLAAKAASSGYFRLQEVSPTYRQAIEGVELGSADVILEIPPRFEEDLIREGMARVSVAVNAVNGTKGGLGSVYLSGIVEDFSGEIRSELSAQGGAASSFEIVPNYRFNPYLEYRIFMVPALMVMMLTMLCGFLPALNIVGEKEKGTIEQINVTPVRKSTFILSKLIPYWVTGFTVLTVCILISWAVYGLFPPGGVGTLYLFTSVFVLAMSGLGLVISNYANTAQQAMFMMFFFVVSLIFLSGLYTPVSSMPEWAQTLSVFSPLKYLIQVLRLTYLKGSQASDLFGAFGALCGFAAFFNIWAVISYRKST